MTWRDSLATALDAIRAHRMRSALTVLGIMVGIVAVILSFGLGAGARADVNAQISELGTNILVVSPGSSTDEDGVQLGFGTASTLTRADADSLTDPVVAPDVQAVAAVTTTSAVATVADTNWTTTLTGTTPSWQDVRSRVTTDGRFLTDQDNTQAASVTVIGPDTATKLFGTTEVVGQTVAVAGHQLEIVGVLEAVTSTQESTANDILLVPSSTMAQRLVGGADRNSVDTIYVKATSEDTLSAAYQEIHAELLALHEVTSDDADFTIASQESILAASTTVDQTLTVMLAGIAGISLLVGGIGVMNIMLVSVNERTREIGLRKALGARPRLIRRQFLLEASMLGLLGGLAGVGVGIASGEVLPSVTSSTVVISPAISAVAIVIAVGIGMVFGVFPATRAARLAPIDALRSE